MKQRIVLRADGNSNIGLGHVYRLLALCDMLKDNFNCVFIINRPTETVKNIIGQYCEVKAIDAGNLTGEIEQLKQIVTPQDSMVLDGYNFDIEYFTAVKKLVNKLVLVDDMADRTITADMVINHGRSGIEVQYKNSGAQAVLCGLEYLLLRKEFLQAAQQPRTIHAVENVFVCMGGADINNVTLRMLQGIAQTDFIKKAVVVIGGAYKHKEALMDFVKTSSIPVEVHENISAQNIIELIKGCQVAISPASTTALEICCVKAGLISGYTADNQLNILEEITSKDMCTSVGDFNTVTTEKIAQLLEEYKDGTIARQQIEKQAVAINGMSGHVLTQKIQELVHA